VKCDAWHTSQLHLAANTVLCWDRAGGTADCSGSAPMEAAARGAQQLRQLDWPTLAVTSPITSAFLLLVTVALWKLLNWIQQKAPSPASGGGAGRSAEARNLTSSGRGLPQQRGALAEVVKSHNEHWKREMPKTGAVSLAQAHALQWSAEDLGQVGSKEELPAYLWVVRSDHPPKSRHCRHLRAAAAPLKSHPCVSPVQGTEDDELAEAWGRLSRWLEASPKLPHPSSSETSSTESSDADSNSSTDSESEVNKREVGREDPPHCKAQRAARTKQLLELLPPGEQRDGRLAKRAVQRLYSQLLWEAVRFKFYQCCDCFTNIIAVTVPRPARSSDAKTAMNVCF
jgi:hypothetical protein